MKLNNESVIRHSILIILAIIIAGCSSTGMKRSEKATTTMEIMSKDIQLTEIQLDATTTSLDELMRSGQSNVKEAFELFKKNVSKIEGMEKSFAKHSEKMTDRGDDYFEEWQDDDEDYTNSEIQQLSEQRRAKLNAIYSKIAEKSVGVNEAFRTYVSNVQEIQLYLSNDLTANGIKSIYPITSKVVDNGVNLKYAIKDVQTAIDRARAAMSQEGM